MIKRLHDLQIVQGSQSAQKLLCCVASKGFSSARNFLWVIAAV